MDSTLPWWRAVRKRPAGRCRQPAARSHGRCSTASAATCTATWRRRSSVSARRRSTRPVDEGVFRSEAAAWFAVALANGGRPDEAAAVVGDHRPDDVAMIPGLGPWAAAAILAARGHHDPAAATVVRAANKAHGSGEHRAEWTKRYLVDAGRYGMAATIAARLQNVLAGIDAPLIHILGPLRGAASTDGRSHAPC